MHVHGQSLILIRIGWENIFPSFLCIGGEKWSFERFKNLPKILLISTLICYLTLPFIEGLMCHSKESGLEPACVETLGSWPVGLEEDLSFWHQNWAPSDLLRLTCNQWHRRKDFMKPWIYPSLPGSTCASQVRKGSFSEGRDREFQHSLWAQNDSPKDFELSYLSDSGLCYPWRTMAGKKGGSISRGTGRADLPISHSNTVSLENQEIFQLKSEERKEL